MGVDAGLTRGVRDVEPLRDRLVCAYALIATIEGITDRERHADLPAPGGLGTIESFAIEYQADVSRGALPGQRREYLLRVRHLRDLRGIDEAGGFDALESRGREPGDELNLDRRRENSGLVLQSIARSHLHDFDRFPHVRSRCRLMGSGNCIGRRRGGPISGVLAPRPVAESPEPMKVLSL